MPKTEKNIQQNEENSEVMEMEKFNIVFSWETTNIIRNNITDLYMLIASVASVLMILWSLYTKNFIVVVTFMMLLAVIILMLSEEPKKVKVKVSESGIDINGVHHDFSEFKSFNISYHYDLPSLNLNLKKAYLPAQTVYIENEPEKDLEEFLEIYLPKEEKKEDKKV